MEFSPELWKVYPQNPAILGEAEKLFADIQKHSRSELKAADVSAVAKVPHKTQVYLQVGLRRAIELTESTIRELNASVLISPFVTTRALFETACVMYHTWNRVKLVLNPDSPAGLKDLDDNIMQLLMGARAEGWGGEVQAKNILTIIDHVDKVITGVREAYNSLSELAHPNFAGMLSAYQEPDIEERRAIFIDPFKERINAIPILLNSICLCLAIIKRSLDEFEENLPAFIRLCEEDIYQSGTWPQDVPYPWA